MREDRLRNAWDDVRMSKRQEERIWRRARAQVYGEKQQKGKRRRLLSIGAAAAVFLAAAVTPVVIHGLRNEKLVQSAFPVELPQTEVPDHYRNYAVIYAEGEKVEDTQSVFHLIVSVNEAQEEVKLMYLPANLKVVGPGEDEENIMSIANLSYRGGVESVSSYLSAQWNIPLEGTIAVNKEGLAELIDYVGGIPLEVTEEELASHLLCRETIRVSLELGRGSGQELITEPGRQILDGVQAVAWNTDFYFTELSTDELEKIRYERGTDLFEQIFLKWREKGLDSKSVLNCVNLRYARDQIQTDMDREEIAEAICRAGEYEIADKISLEDSELRERGMLQDDESVLNRNVWYPLIYSYLYGEPAGGEPAADE